MSRSCTSCGATVPEGEAFCDNCGTPVTGEASESAAARPTEVRKPEVSGPPQAPPDGPPAAAQTSRGTPPPPPEAPGAPVMNPQPGPTSQMAPALPGSDRQPPQQSREAATTPGRGGNRFVGLGLLGLVLVLLLGTGGWFLLSSRDDAPEALQGPSQKDSEAGRAVEQDPSSGETTEGSEATLADANPDSGIDYASVEEVGLGMEVPEDWEVQTGTESEGSGTSWSLILGSVEASVTAAPDLEAWHESGGAAGMYAVAARAFTGYTNEQIITTGPNDLSGLCTLGDARDFAKDAYSSRIQTWTDCGGDPDAKGYTVAIAPEAGGCAVALRIGTVGEGGLETAQHIMDTLEVDCASLPAVGEGITASDVPAEDYVVPEGTTGGYVPPEHTTGGYTPPEGTTPQ